MRDMTEREYEKCRNDCIVFKETESIEEMLDYVLQFKGEPKKNKKIVEYNLYLLAHKGSGFDSYVGLKNLPQAEVLLVWLKTDQALYLSKYSMVM